ncbi:hypothetical protein EI999_11190 [Streptococcus suis]|uniref:YopX family protein n=3 Tax=Streptococcus suis TaxID=1307 RepID=UPI000F63E2CD|nr:YopX family protein [Streptococcus suis]NQL71356.1 hypothetical protein [Streptococcus suis]RRR48834.1 hypothetical protein EI999_11190 [Streptococcus suis]HEL2244877.1 hypothetical protein [Streptococcus suis]HEL2334060.1 hypothetical protein [Streptococcus suis]HEM4294757.1 hypothetical protein [Streptococcus suis]
MIPKFRFFGKVNDGTERMVMADSIDFENGFIYYSYHDYTVEGDDHVYGDVIGFEDCVLMQSTGVFDKNGKEIFEGDVVKIFGEKLSKIYYSDGAFCVDILIGGTPLHAFLSEQLEIIGNIHRNPELMEEVLND